LSDDLLKLIHEGQYDPALRSAKRLSIDLLKQNKRGEAARALATAGHVLCLLNHPSKAKSFAQEAYDLSTRATDALAAGYALAVGALAQLRLAEFDQAVRDIVNFLDYIGEPVQRERQALGIRVIAFLLVFLLIAYLLKKEIWKDVK